MTVPVTPGSPCRLRTATVSVQPNERVFQPNERAANLICGAVAPGSIIGCQNTPYRGFFDTQSLAP